MYQVKFLKWNPGRLDINVISLGCLEIKRGSLTKIHTNHSDALPRVPNRSSMPMGMRLMHETYLFIYLMGACLGGLVSYSCNNSHVAVKAFRLDCLTRLYMGYMLHELARSINSVSITRNLTFEFWSVIILSNNAKKQHTQEVT